MFNCQCSMLNSSPLASRCEFLAMRPQGGEHDAAEALTLCRLQMLQNLAAHARFPEVFHMSGDALCGLNLIGFGVEECSDIVGEFDQTLDVHLLPDCLPFPEQSFLFVGEIL